MKKGEMNREQVIEMVGIESVVAVEKENCDFTNRVQCDGDESVEFSASVKAVDKNGDDCQLIAYYYQSPEAIKAADGDLGSCDWEINGYELFY